MLPCSDGEIKLYIKQYMILMIVKRKSIKHTKRKTYAAAPGAISININIITYTVEAHSRYF